MKRAALILAATLALGGCAHRARLRAIDAIAVRCDREIDIAETDQEIRNIVARCAAQIHEVTDAR